MWLPNPTARPVLTAWMRFGWKDQQASLLSFSGDAYLNEMGITSRLFPDEVAKLCNTAFPNLEIQEHVPETESIRTLRVAINLLGDGFVEAVDDQTLIEMARKQCKDTHHKICGQVLYVPIVEAPGQTGVGRC